MFSVGDEVEVIGKPHYTITVPGSIGFIVKKETYRVLVHFTYLPSGEYGSSETNFTDEFWIDPKYLQLSKAAKEHTVPLPPVWLKIREMEARWKKRVSLS